MISRIRDHEYMGGIKRSDKRIKTNGEVFTPTPLVQEVLDQLPQELFSDPTKTFCDPACGDGQFLSEVLIRKLENGIDIATALDTIFGVDIMRDNVKLCRQRLTMGRDDLMKIAKKNIVCADSLEYHFRFGRREPMAKGISDEVLYYDSSD